MEKSVQLGVRVPPHIKDLLNEAAKSDIRPLTSLVEKILTEWLLSNGWIKKTGVM